MGRSRPRARGYRSWGTTPEAALGAQFLWDAARGVWADPGTGEIPITDGALVVAADEQVTGLLPDRAVEPNPAKQYTWTESDADFGGYPTIGDDVSTARTLVCAGSSALPQPCTIVIVGRWVGVTAGNLSLQDAPTARITCYTAVGTGYVIYAGAAGVAAIGHVYQASQAEVLYWRVNGAGTTAERYLRDGSRVPPGGVAFSPGANPLRGMTWKQDRVPTAGRQGRVALLAYVPGLLPAARQAAFESWLRTTMGWQP